MAHDNKIIKNPLTVVGIFAGLVEVCGSFVLPNLSSGNQAIFVWFLMGFPTLLLLLFFLTLNFNHRVLYAPSDYEDEENFVKAFSPLNPSEKQEKLQEDLAELRSSELSATLSQKSNVVHEVRSAYSVLDGQRKAKYLTAESLALRKIEAEYGDGFQRGVSFSGLGNPRITFDGLVYTKNQINAVEIKYVDALQGLIPRIKKVIIRAAEASKTIPTSSESIFSLMLVLVIDNGLQEADVKRELTSLLNEYRIQVELRIMAYDDLLEKVT